MVQLVRLFGYVQSCKPLQSCNLHLCLVQAFKGIKSLIASTIFKVTDEKGSNPLWPAILYEGVRNICSVPKRVLM